MKYNFAKIAKIAGTCVTILSFVFLVYMGVKYSKELIGDPGLKKILVFVVPCGVIYGLFYSVIIIAWHHMIKQLYGSAKLSVTYPIYAKTQIAKYIPGNVFHYVGRQIMCKAVGIGHKVVLTATAYETLLMMAVSASFSVLGFMLIEMNPAQKNIIMSLGICLGVGGMVSLFLLRKSTFMEKIMPHMSGFSLKDWWKFLLIPLIIYLSFYMFVGIMLFFISIFSFDLEFSFRMMIIFCCLYSAAWVIGFVTPGSPGGMGVREAVIVTGLTPLVGASPALGVAIGLRLITTLGDGVLYCTAYLGVVRK